MERGACVVEKLGDDPSGKTRITHPREGREWAGGGLMYKMGDSETNADTILNGISTLTFPTLISGNPPVAAKPPSTDELVLALGLFSFPKRGKDGRGHLAPTQE